MCRDPVAAGRLSAVGNDVTTKFRPEGGGWEGDTFSFPYQPTHVIFISPRFSALYFHNVVSYKKYVMVGKHVMLMHSFWIFYTPASFSAGCQSN